MRRGLAWRRQRHRAIRQNHRHLRLRARERETQSFLACEQWADGQRVQHPDQACIVKRGWPQAGGDGWRFVRRQKLERARDIASEAVEKGEVIGAIHFPDSADRKPHLVLAARSGTVGVIRGYPRVKRGDCVTLVGDSYSDLSQLPE